MAFVVAIQRKCLPGFTVVSWAQLSKKEFYELAHEDPRTGLSCVWAIPYMSTQLEFEYAGPTELHVDGTGDTEGAQLENLAHGLAELEHRCEAGVSVCVVLAESTMSSSPRRCWSPVSSRS